MAGVRVFDRWAAGQQQQLVALVGWLRWQRLQEAAPMPSHGETAEPAAPHGKPQFCGSWHPWTTGPVGGGAVLPCAPRLGAAGLVQGRRTPVPPIITGCCPRALAAGWAWRCTQRQDCRGRAVQRCRGVGRCVGGRTPSSHSQLRPPQLRGGVLRG
eukprot:COSAG01_NODE_20142_length_967_cov_167.849252_2_plen_156_part_00